jgi:hypothetical protein
MKFLVQVWNALDFTSSTSNAFFAFFCTALGYWMSVWWNRRQVERDRAEEKRSLFRSIGFFISDCMIAMRDADVNLEKNMPPHRSIPCSGIEYFQVQLMRHGENELFVDLATLRGVIEQANQLVPAMLQQFTTSPADAIAPSSKPSVLQLHCLRLPRLSGHRHPC